MALAELPITGYFDRFSRRQGEDLALHVSVPSGGDVRARLERVISGDPNPAGPGMRFEDLSHRFDTIFPGRHQPIRLGSHAVIAHGPPRPLGPTTWTALLWLAADAPRDAALISEEDPDATATLFVTPTGVAATIGGQRVATDVKLPLRAWHRVWLSADPATGRVTVGHRAIEGGPIAGGPIEGRSGAIAEAMHPGLSVPTGAGPILLGACDHAAPRAHLTGKLEDPAIRAGVIDLWPLPDVPLDPADPALLAGWDFSHDIAEQTITDIGPHACHGTLVNVPTRAVVGARWSGAEMCWRHAPRDYAAIHFHADDLADCGWTPDLQFRIPDDLPSGAYVLRLTTEGGEDPIPFYVLPPRGTPRPPVVFLASTFTYQAYANHSRGNCNDSLRARMRDWGAYPHNPDDYPIYGRSTYNRHPDNGGVMFSSRLRPILTMRPGFLTFDDARGSGLRHYPADTHILAWLDALGIEFDVITDEDLHEEGEALLAPYRIVLTGSHPEYHTRETLDALQHYTRNGGGLAYLGGNGFYWRIACNAGPQGLIELRRAEGGIRAWAAEPGEYYHQTDGQYGGLWRRNRRPPQMLAGVGFSGQGLFEGMPYHRLPASHDPAFAWLFDGIDEEVLGDEGLSGGGAAGFELDRADVTLGTPTNAVILARSNPPLPSFVTVPEDVLSIRLTTTGEEVDALRRAEIVYFDTPGGGAVFSVGSITFCGSLWHRGRFGGPISRLLENVIRRLTRGGSASKVSHQ